MENQITKIFKNLTDDEIRTGVIEIKEDSEKGIIRSGGLVRKVTDEILEIMGDNALMQLFLSECGILREAAYRFTSSSSNHLNPNKINEFYAPSSTSAVKSDVIINDSVGNELLRFVFLNDMSEFAIYLQGDITASKSKTLNSRYLLNDNITIKNMYNNNVLMNISKLPVSKDTAMKYVQCLIEHGLKNKEDADKVNDFIKYYKKFY